MPVTNFKQLQRFAANCGAGIPALLAAQFDGLEDDIETRRMVATHLATQQCQDLIADGHKELHFYTLNRADLTYAICHVLGLRPIR